MPAVALQPATWDAVAVGTGAAILIVVTGKCSVQVCVGRRPATDSRGHG